MNPAERHSAGAIVMHTTPFDHLPSFRNEFELSRAFLDKWVAPFYMQMWNPTPEWIAFVKSIKHEITAEAILHNLGDFNWRTRQTGAYFAAITDQPQYIDIIGTHFLKSEVCYAGAEYSLVLAAFNRPESADYLNRYLTHYLAQLDLWFDQGDAMQALQYLDLANGTHHLDQHLPAWERFVRDKQGWSPEINMERFHVRLGALQEIRAFSSI